MNRYEIKCTEEQTKKALELGAPIDFFEENDEHNEHVVHVGQGLYAIIPTAEQIIGWLEDKEIFLEMRHTDEKMFHIWVGSFIPYPDGSWTKSYPTIKEATLAAIDAALEYLTNQKTK